MSTDRLIRLLDTVDDLAAFAGLRQRGYDLLDLAPGAAVVDVGCGTGRALAELAERGARPVGVDVDEQMIGLARERRPGLEVRMAGAGQLPLGDGSVAGYRADKVFHMLTEPERALAEARRVLAPGGRIALVGQDWDAFVVDADDRALTRTILHARADLIPEPWAARRYRTMLRAAGFAGAEVEVHTLVFTDPLMLPVVLDLAKGAPSEEAAAAWAKDQTARARDGRLLLAIPMFLATATR
jgi:ubiquinone/menaquinone biosynthesis C-methylase UbiE